MFRDSLSGFGEPESTRLSDLSGLAFANPTSEARVARLILFRPVQLVVDPGLRAGSCVRKVQKALFYLPCLLERSKILRPRMQPACARRRHSAGADKTCDKSQGARGKQTAPEAVPQEKIKKIERTYKNRNGSVFTRTIFACTPA